MSPEYTVGTLDKNGAPGEIDQNSRGAVFDPSGAPAASKTLARFIELPTTWFEARNVSLYFNNQFSEL